MRIVIRCNSRVGEREIIHLLFSIVVTAPVLHFDKSELNADAEANTAKERVEQRKRKNPPEQKVPFQKQK